LVGDAAHTTGPIGAHSLNVGLFEAYDLAGRLADVLSGGAREPSLRAYADDRQEEWKSLLGIGVDINLPKQAPAWLRKHADELVPCLPASGHHLDQLLARLGVSLEPEGAAPNRMQSRADAH
jgi:2-polyprenyl-6-methoxyphenol hydroxylase-like FAD-dependent oxidoreductase